MIQTRESLVVDAKERARIPAVAERENTSTGEVKKRMQFQWSASRKVQKADYLIHNKGSIEELDTAVCLLDTLFTHLSKKG